MKNSLEDRLMNVIIKARELGENGIIISPKSIVLKDFDLAKCDCYAPGGNVDDAERIVRKLKDEDATIVALNGVLSYACHKRVMMFLNKDASSPKINVLDTRFSIDQLIAELRHTHDYTFPEVEDEQRNMLAAQALAYVCPFMDVTVQYLTSPILSQVHDVKCLTGLYIKNPEMIYSTEMVQCNPYSTMAVFTVGLLQLVFADDIYYTEADVKRPDICPRDYKKCLQALRDATPECLLAGDSAFDVMNNVMVNELPMDLTTDKVDAFLLSCKLINAIITYGWDHYLMKFDVQYKRKYVENSERMTDREVVLEYWRQVRNDYIKGLGV